MTYYKMFLGHELKCYLYYTCYKIISRKEENKETQEKHDFFIKFHFQIQARYNVLWARQIWQSNWNMIPDPLPLSKVATRRPKKTLLKVTSLWTLILIYLWVTCILANQNKCLKGYFRETNKNGVVRRSVGICSQGLSAEHKFILDALRESKDRNAMKPTIWLVKTKFTRIWLSAGFFFS